MHVYVYVWMTAKLSCGNHAIAKHKLTSLKFKCGFTNQIFFSQAMQVCVNESFWKMMKLK